VQQEQKILRPASQVSRGRSQDFEPEGDGWSLRLVRGFAVGEPSRSSA
jgi:hypothetical protein